MRTKPIEMIPATNRYDRLPSLDNVKANPDGSRRGFCPSCRRWRILERWESLICYVCTGTPRPTPPPSKAKPRPPVSLGPPAAPEWPSDPAQFTDVQRDEYVRRYHQLP